LRHNDVALHPLPELRGCLAQHLGAEPATTPGGTFACDRYAFGDPSRIWVHGEDRMPVRLRFAAADRGFVVAAWKVMT